MIKCVSVLQVIYDSKFTSASALISQVGELLEDLQNVCINIRGEEKRLVSRNELEDVLVVLKTKND